MNFALRRRALIAAQKEYIIPPEYREIESLTFTGDQWFDTGIHLNNNTRIEIDITPTVSPTSTTCFYWGAYDGTIYSGLVQTKNVLTIRYFYGQRTGDSNFETITYNSTGEFLQQKVIDTNGENYFDINGQRLLITTQHTFAISLTAYFGSCNRTDGEYPAYFISRKSKWYEDGTTLSRFYVPVRRLSDDVGGMFDVVNNTFNPSMTSTPFVKGADV